LITAGTIWIVRDKSGRECFASTRMSADWQAKLERDGHEVFEFPFELPGPSTIPAPPPSAHGCWEEVEDT
jgi:hypothetical protein